MKTTRLTTYLIALVALSFSCASKKTIANTNSETIVVKQTVKKTAIDSAIISKPPAETFVEENAILTDLKTKKTPINTTTRQVFDHKLWHNLLQKHIAKTGEVNYIGFKNDKKLLNTYINQLSNNTPKPNWSKNDKFAYWMNAYNALTIDLILRNLPLKSIKDIKDPWDQRLWKLGEKWYNLNEIEHQILRKMGDARIHFGINCASFSCPPLLNEAFTAKTVNAQLNQLAVRFINDTERNEISKDHIKISKIFNWFAKDFKQNGGLINFLNRYSNTIISKSAKKNYLDYNWSLNTQ